jgi:hypothetical protein
MRTVRPPREYFIAQVQDVVLVRIDACSADRDRYRVAGPQIGQPSWIGAAAWRYRSWSYIDGKDVDASLLGWIGRFGFLIVEDEAMGVTVRFEDFLDGLAHFFRPECGGDAEHFGNGVPSIAGVGTEIEGVFFFRATLLGRGMHHERDASAGYQVFPGGAAVPVVNELIEAFILRGQLV